LNIGFAFLTKGGEASRIDFAQGLTDAGRGDGFFKLGAHGDFSSVMR
jgi:hypothetical protein